MFAIGKKVLLVLILIIGTIVVGLAAVVGISLLEETFLIPDQFLFYEHQGLADRLLVWLIMIPVVILFFALTRRLGLRTNAQLEEGSDAFYFWNHLGRGKFAVILLWLFALYCCVINTAVVTENSVIYYSLFHPTGITYSYSDVEEIHTGFGKSSLAVLEYKRKGNFYYQIKVDGRQVTFSQPSVNGKIEKYEEDTYLELEEFDEALVRYGIPKQGDREGYSDCNLDTQYVERFLRIIERNAAS